VGHLTRGDQELQATKEVGCVGTGDGIAQANEPLGTFRAAGDVLADAEPEPSGGAWDPPTNDAGQNDVGHVVFRNHERASFGQPDRTGRAAEQVRADRACRVRTELAAIESVELDRVDV
jgi:hypothetical protein